MLVVVHFALLLLLPLATAAATVALLRLLVSRNARRLTARGRRRVEELCDEATGVTLVRGRLVVGREGLAEVTSPRGTVGACSAWLSRPLIPMSKPWRGESDRAAHLAIDTSDGVVVLAGAVSVEAGSELRSRGRRSHSDRGHGTVTNALLCEGDEVIAAGQLGSRPGPDGSGEYRAQATERTLEPIAAYSTVQLAASAPAIVSMSWRLFRKHPAVLLAALALCYPGCRAAADYAGMDCSDCSRNGNCHTIPAWRLTALPRAFERMLDGNHFRCASLIDDDCTATDGCVQYGLCSTVDGACQADSRTNCAHTPSCLAYGFCTPVDGICRAAEADDCLHTESCHLYGSCVVRDGGCKIASDEGCRRAESCRDWGRCSEQEGNCVALNDEDCAQSLRCLAHARCTAVNGECGPGLEGCRNSNNCHLWGACTPRELGCEVTSDEDCLRSDGCAKDRKCRFQTNGPKGCVEDAPSCRESAACRILGRCSGASLCFAASDQDCKGARVCKEEGACEAIDQGCGVSCKASEACRRDGRCTREGDHCVAASDADCASSAGCKKYGQCSASNGRCRAKTGGDCASTSRCRSEGRCSVVGSSCRLTADADCAKTLGCERAGRCRYTEAGCVVMRDEDCRKTPGCAELGHCSADPRSDRGHPGRCMAVKDEDCQGSEACKRRGWCMAIENPEERQRSTLPTICFTPPPQASRAKR